MSLWALSISPKAQKDIASLDKEIAGRILEKLEWLEENINSIAPQRLSANLAHSYKLRVGDYRIVYDLNRRFSIIYVDKVEHRSKIYRK